MTERVRLGRLDNGDYGLMVTSPDGSTIIIDGTSNMFKIMASGSLSGTKSDGSDGTVAEITLTGLGPQTAAPSFLTWIATGTGATQNRVIGSNFSERTELWAAPTSGGAVNQDFIAFREYTRVRLHLTSDNLIEIQLVIDNQSGGDITRYSRYYIMQETGE